jgi:hypothetical protein
VDAKMSMQMEHVDAPNTSALLSILSCKQLTCALIAIIVSESQMQHCAKNAFAIIVAGSVSNKFVMRLVSIARSV